MSHLTDKDIQEILQSLVVDHRPITLPAKLQRTLFGYVPFGRCKLGIDDSSVYTYSGKWWDCYNWKALEYLIKEKKNIRDISGLEIKHILAGTENLAMTSPSYKKY